MASGNSRHLGCFGDRRCGANIGDGWSIGTVANALSIGSIGSKGVPSVAKWYAFALIVGGIALIAPSKPPGEFGLPLYALAGWACLVSGLVWVCVLVFLKL